MSMDNAINPNKCIDLWAGERSNDDFAVSFRVKDVLFSVQSPYQKVEIVDTAGYGKMLFNDGIVMISERDEFIYHEMIAHVPLFLHPDPKDVLVIGGGDGGTVREVLKHPGIETCTLCEIDETVIKACQRHIPRTAACLDGDDPRVKIECRDAAEFIQEDTTRYDIILIDSSDPVGPAAPLFGDDFYKNISSSLRENGIVVSQAESPFIYADIQRGLLEIVKRQFGRVFVYNYSNMTYPGGLWSFSLAAKQPLHPVSGFYHDRFEETKLEVLYYSKEMHRSSFCLPPFQQDHLRDIISPVS